jgi:hypothetical protein
VLDELDAVEDELVVDDELLVVVPPLDEVVVPLDEVVVPLDDEPVEPCAPPWPPPELDEDPVGAPPWPPPGLDEDPVGAPPLPLEPVEAPVPEPVAGLPPAPPVPNGTPLLVPQAARTEHVTMTKDEAMRIDEILGFGGQVGGGRRQRPQRGFGGLLQLECVTGGRCRRRRWRWRSTASCR